MGIDHLIAAKWGGMEHEGGAVSLDGNVVGFGSGGTTCIVWTQTEASMGKHIWRIRVDEVHHMSGYIALGVASGVRERVCLCDMNSWQNWYLYYSDDGKKKAKGDNLELYSEPYAAGGVI